MAETVASMLGNRDGIEKEGGGIRCFGCNQPLCQTEEQVLSSRLQNRKSTRKATADLLSDGAAKPPPRIN